MTILRELPIQLSSPAMAYAALLMIGSVWIAQSHWHRELVDWRGTAAFLQETAQPGDAIAMPKVYPLLEYYFPELEIYRTADLDSGPGALSNGTVNRRIVVCYDGMNPDPCEGFRSAAMEDESWTEEQREGLMLFIRN
jgi:hypothetical protein